MKPDVPRFLAIAAAHMVGRTAPALGGNGYEQSSATALGGLMVAISEEFERAAARRIEENAALRALFREAAPVVHDPALRTRLEESAASSDPTPVVSALEQANAELRALLIDLHVHVESLDAPAARELERAIWQELVRSTERRKLAMGPY